MAAVGSAFPSVNQGDTARCPARGSAVPGLRGGPGGTAGRPGRVPGTAAGRGV